jgi:hypothetical protein
VAFRYVTVHWDGVSWNHVEAPNQGVLYAVAASSGTDAWAVGFGFDSLAYSTGTYTLRYTVCPADFTGDGILDFADYLEFLNLFEADDPRADLNGDGLVDFADYLEFLDEFDTGC